MKTYGTISLSKDRKTWILDAAPHVVLRLKRLFPGVSRKTAGTLRVSNTRDACVDLAWVLARWPMTFKHDRDRAELERVADEHARATDLLDELLQGGRPPRPFELAVPAREYQKIAADAWLTTRGLLLADDVGLGKAQPLDAKVLTPSGWREIGSLRVGNDVVDPDGGTAAVTGVFRRGVRQAFRVTTRDGASTECCAEHLWGVYSANDRARGGAMRVLELRELMGDLKRPHARSSWETSKWFLPLPVPIDGHDGALPLPGYLVGAILGDGGVTGRSVVFSCAEGELLDRVRALLPLGVEPRRAGKIEWRLSRTSMRMRRNPVVHALDELGVMGNGALTKRIPGAYMQAEAGSRLELLRGLMDTDGDCTSEGTSVLSTSSDGLRDDVVELVRSLGGIASVSTKAAPKYRHKGEAREGRPAHRVNVRLPVCPFHLTRKAERWKPPIMARPIESIEPTREAEMVCIAVSSKRNLYITDGHLVTHNTCSAIAALTDPATRPALVVTLAHLPRQWEAEIRKFAPSLATHVLAKSTPYDLRRGARKGGAEQALLPGLSEFPDVIISTYHKLAGWEEALAGRVRSVVFDECQELRSGPGKRDRPIKKNVAAARIAEAAEFRIGLSATPIYNYGGEFFNVLGVLRPAELGTKAEFAAQWCRGGYNDKAQIQDPAAFGSWLRDQGLMLRRTRQDVGRELPELVKIPHHIDCDRAPLDDVQDSATQLARFIVERGAGAERTRGDVMQASEELSNLVRQATGVAKAPHVADFVRLLVENGEPVVLYGWHRSVYDIWTSRLRDLKPALYTGSESATQKQAAKEAFVSGATDVLIMSLRSGAGLDGLQHRGRTVVFGELDWSPGVHEQAAGRVHRDGQASSVVAYFLITDSGSDPIVADVLGVKRAQIAGVRDPAGSLVEKLDTGSDRIRRLAEAYVERRA